MQRVCIGIHAHAEPGRLHTTLTSLRAHTAWPVELLLLPDGPDDETSAALASLRDLPQSGTAEPQGPPACFNRLVTATAAEAWVLLESGCLVGPGWLDHLLAALGADPRNGLAGPSTNLSCNEQAVFPHAGDTLEDVRRTAQDALQLFGPATRTLEPLYSLADFCYAVRREVVEAVGAADEGYGLGPCWEMDYSVRAARAGFRGIWACAAYVQRAPFTARRQREEALRFEASKQRYQDRFCGARLRGEKSDYRSHCRGDACPNFALPALIPRGRPLPLIGPVDNRLPPSAPPETVDKHRIAEGPPALGAAEPLVSCIMPTCDRRTLIPQALRGFLRQDYPHLELVVVDDGADPIADCLPQDPRVRYVRLGEKCPVGTKRNVACAQARGDVIMHWDDDDWYPPWRVRAQVQALFNHRAEVCGSSRLFYYQPDADRAWHYSYTGQGPPWVAGNTLAYRKRFWERNRFPDVQTGEDACFVWGSPPEAVCDLKEPALCVGMIHPANTSPKVISEPYWRPEPVTAIHQLLGDDLTVYWAAFAPARAGARLSARAHADLPLVSCIMPTYNRRPFVVLALKAFSRQDYPNRELLIIDDGTDPVGDLAEGVRGVRYLRLASRTSIGAKRNLACRDAAGEIIAHWDDDDWYAPDRLRYQVGPLLEGRAELTGLENSFLLELPAGTFWTTSPELHQRMFVGDVHGGTLVYRKALLEAGLRYPEIDLAEDAWLIWEAQGRGHRLVRLANSGVFVYVRHGGNAWPFEAGRFLDPAGWKRTDSPCTCPREMVTEYSSAAAHCRRAE
jgi:glycosyltransferase involved in cell wall biosynthesis